MPFPDAEHAIITQEKLGDYLLNFAHPIGGPKAAWFASLGYTQQNWEQLRGDLLRVAESCENFIPKSSPFGVKYETEGVFGCEGYRPATVPIDLARLRSDEGYRRKTKTPSPRLSPQGRGEEQDEHNRARPFSSLDC